MATFSITMMSLETEVYIQPPLNKPIKYIEVLECHAPKEWITFNIVNNIASTKPNGSPSIDSIRRGSYTIKSLQNEFSKSEVNHGLKILAGRGNDYYLSATNDSKPVISGNLADSLGISTELDKGKSYFLQPFSKRIMKVYCDLVDEHSSYENEAVKNDSVTIKPSQFLAFVPSEKYPLLNVSSSKHPINYFTIKIFDEDGKKLHLLDEPIRITLKLHF